MSNRVAHLRLAAPADLVAVERIEHDSFDDPWPTAALLQELVPSNLRWPVVVTIDEVVVGYLMAWRSVDQLHILNIAVSPEQRRRGLGAFMLDAALDEARKYDMDEVTLEVRPGNTAALAMYRSRGFEERGIRPGYYADTGEDALVLTLDLRHPVDPALGDQGS